MNSAKAWLTRQDAWCRQLPAKEIDMFADVQTPASNNPDRSPQREVGGHGKRAQTSRPSGGDAAPAANGKPTCCLTLRRGPQLMVLFRGCPHPSVVLSLRQAQVMIGLALSPDNLKMIRRLDCYSYVFVSSHSRADSALAQAASDLIRANWSIDDNTTWSSAAIHPDAAIHRSSSTTTLAADHLIQRCTPNAPGTGAGRNMVWVKDQPKTTWRSPGTP